MQAYLGICCLHMLKALAYNVNHIEYKVTAKYLALYEQKMSLAGFSSFQYV